MQELNISEIEQVNGGLSGRETAGAVVGSLGGMATGLGTIGSASAAIAFGGAVAFTGGAFVLAVVAIYYLTE